jgi:nuclear polyadenylated RNA-binding protein 3
VNWVQSAFIERGLKVDVMFLNPRLPRDLVIQRQVVEGVHGVSELDFRSQSIAKIPLQTFDRSTGRHNARFDQYQDLEPKIAAEIVTRARSQSQLQSPAGYGNGHYPLVNYPAHSQMPPQHYASMPGQPPSNINLGGLDNATLQRVLSAVHGNPGAGIPNQPQMGPTPSVDVNAVLSALGAGGTAATPSQQQPITYPPAPAPGNPSDQAHVQNIMAQLSRYRQ